MAKKRLNYVLICPVGSNYCLMTGEDMIYLLRIFRYALKY